MRILEAHSWPGNVRELQSAIRYALVHAVGNVLTPCCLPESIRNEPETAAESGTLARPPRRDHALPDVARCVKRLLASGQNEIYRQVLQQVDRTVMDTVLKHVGGNQVQASELLGISRTTLRARLEQNHQEAAPDP